MRPTNIVKSMKRSTTDRIVKAAKRNRINVLGLESDKPVCMVLLGKSIQAKHEKNLHGPSMVKIPCVSLRRWCTQLLLRLSQRSRNECFSVPNAIPSSSIIMSLIKIEDEMLHSGISILHANTCNTRTNLNMWLAILSEQVKPATSERDSCNPWLHHHLKPTKLLTSGGCLCCQAQSSLFVYGSCVQLASHKNLVFLIVGVIYRPPNWSYFFYCST